MQTRRELLQGLASAAAATFVLPEPRARASGDVAKIVHPSLVAKKLTGKEVSLIAELYDRYAVIE